MSALSQSPGCSLAIMDNAIEGLSYKGHLRKRLHLSVMSEDTLSLITYVIWSCVEAKYPHKLISSHCCTFLSRPFGDMV